MAYLPNQEYDDLATKSDVEAAKGGLSVRIDQVDSTLSARIDTLDSTLSARIDRLDSEMIHRFDAVNQRLDNIVLTLAAGLIAIIVAMIVQGFI
jgi:hypothetical protein